MATDSVSPSGRPQRSVKKSRKGEEVAADEKSEQAAKRRSISPKYNASSTASSTNERTSTLSNDATNNDRERKVSDTLQISTASTTTTGQVTTEVAHYRLPSPALELPFRNGKPATSPKSRKASPKTSKSTSPPPLPTFACNDCGRPYTVALSLEGDPLQRPMQTHRQQRLPHNHHLLARDQHGKWRSELIDAQLRQYPSKFTCYCVYRKRQLYVQVCEEQLLNAEYTHGMPVPSQAEFRRGVQMPAAPVQRGLQPSRSDYRRYVDTLIAENDRKTRDRYREAWIKRCVEGTWEREAEEAGLSVEDFLRPKKLNMRTSMSNGRVARAANSREIKADLAAIGLTTAPRHLAYDRTVRSGYDDVECRSVEFYGVDGKGVLV